MPATARFRAQAGVRMSDVVAMLVRRRHGRAGASLAKVPLYHSIPYTDQMVMLAESYLGPRHIRCRHRIHVLE